MKKTYLKPTMMVVPVQVNQIICTSVQSNVNLGSGGATPLDFDEDDIR